MFDRLAQILAKETWIWLLCAIVSLIAATVLVSGWPGGVIPKLSYPYTYSRDGPAALWLIQRLLDGWIFHGDRSGYPFGSDFLDYPMSDTGSFVVIKFLGSLTHSHWATLNLYFLLGFPVASIASYIVLRTMGISRLLSVSTSVEF